MLDFVNTRGRQTREREDGEGFEDWKREEKGGRHTASTLPSSAKNHVSDDVDYEAISAKTLGDDRVEQGGEREKWEEKKENAESTCMKG